MAQPVDRSNVQGLVFDVYRYPLSRHFLLRCGEATAARRFLAEWVPRVTHGRHDLEGKPEPLVVISDDPEL